MSKSNLWSLHLVTPQREDQLLRHFEVMSKKQYEPRDSVPHLLDLPQDIHVRQTLLLGVIESLTGLEVLIAAMDRVIFSKFPCLSKTAARAHYTAYAAKTLFLTLVVKNKKNTVQK